LNLFGVESEDDCRVKLDALLALLDRAEQAMSREPIGELKSLLRSYYRMGDVNGGSTRMSRIETQYFWPAVRDAYVHAPKLSSPRTWNTGLCNIEHALRYFRPPKK